MHIKKALSFLCFLALTTSLHAEKHHFLSTFDQPKYASGKQEYFDYVNPDAPKGGTLKLQYEHGFDSLNPYVFKGTAAPGLLGMVYAPLFMRAADEPFSLYGWVAESAELAPDKKSWMIVHLRETAAFHDGSPVMADDLIATDKVLKEKGNPARKLYQKRVIAMQKLGPRSVKFVFDPETTNREVPLIMGLMPVFPKKFIDAQDFDHTTHITPNATGPYRVADFVPGQYVVYKRIPGHWSENLMCMKGQYNFGTVRFDVYRDRNVAKEALKATKIDIFQATDPLAFEREFNIPPVKDGRLIKIDFKHDRPFGMFGFVLNMRRPPFDNIKVREALNLAFDYEWLNKNYYKGLYHASRSFFNNSAFDSSGKAQPKEPHRKRLLKAIDLLKQAGFVLKNNQMVNRATGKPLEIELIYRAVDHERFVAALRSHLGKIGVKVKDRFVDSAQFVQRTQDYDFDSIVWLWGVTASPGQELFYYFGSESADKPGTRNYMGLKDIKVDSFIRGALEANTYDDYIEQLKGLDNQLLSHQFCIPLGYWNHDYYLKAARLKEPKIDAKLNRKLQLLATEDRAIKLWWEEKGK